MTLFQSTVWLLTLGLLVKAQIAPFNSCSWNYYGHICKFDICGHIETFECSNITTKATLQLYSTQQRIYCSYDYGSLNIANVQISSIDKHLLNLGCKLYELVLTNNSIKNLANDTFSEYNTIRALKIDHNELTNLDFLYYLEQLRDLNISFNKLQVINKSDLSNLSFLKELWLNNNFINYIEDASFENLNDLTTMQLNNNKLQVLTRTMFTGLTNLQHLNLQDNPIKSIESYAFSDHNNLYLIDISGSKTEILQANIFFGLNNIENFNLNMSNIRDIQPGAFNSMNQLGTLDLTKNKLKILQKNAFSGLINLQYLYLQGNSIKSIEPEAFNDLNNLYSIDISGSNIEILQQNAFMGLHSLTSLNLTNCSIKNIEPGTFNSMNSLVVLDLSANEITNLAGRTFDGLKSLQQLYLLNNKISYINEYSFYGLRTIEILNLCGGDCTNSKYEDKIIFNTITLSDNNFQVENNTFEGLNSLKTQNFVNLNIFKIQGGGFRGLNSLQYIYLYNTTVNRIESSAFIGLDDISLIQSGFSNNIRLDQSGAWYDFSSLSMEFIGADALGNLRYYENGYNVLYLNKNNFKVLVGNTFRNVLHLNILKLDNNNIDEIQPFAFNNMSFHKNAHYYEYQGLKQYNTLDLNNNNLSILNRNTFGKVLNVVELRLDNNNIDEIQPEAFSGLSFHYAECCSNNILYLNENKLEYLQNYTFKNIQNLGILRLDNNQIKELPANIFIDLGKLEVLDLRYNKISMLGPESFAGLNKLRHLLINNNKIKEMPLGTLKNFPQLTNLQLGNNYLSKFRTGSFSNLGELNYLNLSHNSFSALNVTVLYPLRNLNLLDLDDNKFSYINYTSLLMHLPNLQFISVNDNKWACELLTHMLKTFRARGVNYLFNGTSRYLEENVDGIFCTEGPTRDIVTNTSNIDKIVDVLNVIKEGFDELRQNRVCINPDTNSEALEATKVTNLDKDNLMKQFNESAVTSTNLSNVYVNFPTSLYIMCILIVLSCMIMCMLLVLSTYKKYYHKINRDSLTEARSEIELLNASSTN